VEFVRENMASYVNQVNVLHRQYQSALKRARSRQSVLNLYWAHKRQHERLLKKHLREEMVQVTRIKNKIDYK
jgi:hypothetical protein